MRIYMQMPIMIERAVVQCGLSSTVENFALNKLAYNSGCKVELKSTVLLGDVSSRRESLKGMSERNSFYISMHRELKN